MVIRHIYISNTWKLKYMSKHGLISYEHDDNAKCEMCIQAKWQEALLKIP